MADTTEHEAITRFVDGTRYAADYMLQLQFIDKFPKASTHLLKYVRDASGSAHQLGHMQQNPIFFEIRDQLESMMRNAANVALQNHIGKKCPMVGGRSVFVHNSDLLKALSILGKKIASGKSMKRVEALAIMDIRERKVKAELKEAENANAIG